MRAGRPSRFPGNTNNLSLVLSLTSRSHPHPYPTYILWRLRLSLSPVSSVPAWELHEGMSPSLSAILVRSLVALDLLSELKETEHPPG